MKKLLKRIQRFTRETEDCVELVIRSRNGQLKCSSKVYDGKNAFITIHRAENKEIKEIKDILNDLLIVSTDKAKKSKVGREIAREIQRRLA